MKRLLLMVAASALLMQPLHAQRQSYVDWKSQDMDSLLMWFKDGVPTDQSKLKDLEFKRSHVRPRAVIVDRSTQLDTSIDPRRSVFANLPIGGNDLLTGLPSGNFDEDVFSMWPYINIHGNWSNPFFSAPAAYTDAAHKHGASALSSWFFGWYWEYASGKSKAEDGDSYKVELMTKKDAQGRYIYAEPMMDIMQYFGMDGINYNSETIYKSAAAKMQGLHQKLYDLAKERGYSSFHVGWYNGASSDGEGRGSRSSLSSSNDAWYYNSSNKQFASDAFMLDYGWGYDELNSSVSRAKTIGAPNGALDVYAGMWLVDIRGGYFPALDAHKEVSIGLWGEHKMNRFFQHRSGLDLKGVQKSYQDRLEWFFSGKTQNPKDAKSNATSNVAGGVDNDEYLKKFHGIAKHVAERSTVQGSLPFATNFNLGNGLSYYDRSVKTLGNWYNLSAQDMTPTYRWLITGPFGEAAGNVKARFSHDDAWIGGSSLLLEGTAKTTPTDITLYRTRLTTKKQDSYSVKPVTPMGFTVDAVNECATLVDLKMVWSMSSDNKARLVYNDEVNVDHFEIWLREPSKEQKMVAHTSSWAHYLPKYEWPNDAATTFEVGVRAVAQDLTTTSDMVWRTVTRNPAADTVACAGGGAYCEAVNDLGQATYAHLVRYFDSAYTTGADANILVHGQAAATPGLEGYAPFLNDTIKVTPGSSFTFKADAIHSALNESGTPVEDGMQWNKYRVYADWNGDGEFDPDIEMIHSGGKEGAGDLTVCHLNFLVNVPGNANPGVTRMRVRYADAWVAHPGACGMASGGYTADFCILVAGEVQGGTPGGSEPTVTTPPAFNGPDLNALVPNVYLVYKLDGASAGAASNLSVLLKKKGAAAPVAYPIGVAALEGWNEVNIPLTEYIPTDTIVSIGLRAQSAADAPLKAYIGELKLLPGVFPPQKVTVTPDASHITDLSITSAYVQGVGDTVLVEYGDALALTFKVAAVGAIPMVFVDNAPLSYTYDAATNAYTAVTPPVRLGGFAVGITADEPHTITVVKPAWVDIVSASGLASGDLQYAVPKGGAFTLNVRLNEDNKYEAPEVTIGSTPYSLPAADAQGVYTIAMGAVSADTTITITAALQKFVVSVTAGDHVTLQTSASDTVAWGSSATIRFTLDEGYNPVVKIGGVEQAAPAPDTDGAYAVAISSVTAAVSVSISAAIQQLDVTLTREEGKVLWGSGTTTGTKKVSYAGDFPFSFRMVGDFLPELKVNDVEVAVGIPDASGLYRDTVRHITSATTIHIAAKQQSSGGEEPTGVSAEAADAPSFFPNPVNDVITFVNTDKASIYTVSGALVGVYTAATVSIAHLPAGVYVVKMQRGSYARTARLIKN